MIVLLCGGGRVCESSSRRGSESDGCSVKRYNTEELVDGQCHGKKLILSEEGMEKFVWILRYLIVTDKKVKKGFTNKVSSIW